MSADDVVGIVVAREQERVGHAHHRQVLVRLAPAVAAARASVLACPHEVPHVVGEHAVLDEHVALRGRALVVDRVGAPLARVGAVVDQRDERRRDQLADAARGTPTRPRRRGRPRARGRTPRGTARRPRRACSTTGSLPRGAGRARSIVSARSRGGARHLLGVDLVEQLEADRAAGRLDAGLHAGVADRDAVAPRSGCGPGRPRRAGRRSWRSRIRRRASAYVALTWRIESLTDAGGVVGPFEHLGLAGLGHRLGQHAATSCAGRGPRRSSATTRVSPSEPCAAAAAASAASRSPASLRSAVWANPVVLAAHDADARRRARGPTRTPRPCRRRGAPSRCAGPRRTPRRSHRRGAARSGACVGVPLLRSTSPPAGVVYRRPMPLRPGLSAAVELVVTEGDTALALQHRRRPRARDTTRRRPWPRKRRSRRSTASSPRARTSVGYRVQLDHLAPTAVGGHVHAEATLEADRGPPAHLPGVGERRPRPRRRRPHHPRHRRARRASWRRPPATDARPAGAAQRGTRARNSPSPSARSAGSRTAASGRHRARPRARRPARSPRCRASAGGTVVSSSPTIPSTGTCSTAERRRADRAARRCPRSTSPTSPVTARSTCSRRTPGSPGRSASTRWYAGDPSRSSSSGQLLQHCDARGSGRPHPETPPARGRGRVVVRPRCP